MLGRGDVDPAGQHLRRAAAPERRAGGGTPAARRPGDHVRAARPDPRVGRGRRGAADVHRTVVVRLLRRPRRRQPGVPGRRRRMAAGLGARAAGAAGRHPRVVRRSAGARTALPLGRAGRHRRAARGRRMRSTARCPATIRRRTAARASCCTSTATARSTCCGWRCRWPTKSTVDAARAGDDLVVTVAGHRRVLSLPSVLRRCDVVGGDFDGRRAAGAVPPGPGRCGRQTGRAPDERAVELPDDGPATDPPVAARRGAAAGGLGAGLGTAQLPGRRMGTPTQRMPVVPAVPVRGGAAR